MPRADRHTLLGNGHPSDTIDWLAKYGYRGGVGQCHGIGAVLVFSRKNQPVKIALVGETLIYKAKLDEVCVEE